MARITSETINIEKDALTEIARTEQRKKTRPSLDEHSTKKENREETGTVSDRDIKAGTRDKEKETKNGNTIEKEMI